MTTIIFAAISDAKLGRAKTILVGYCVYLFGYILAILITNKNTHICPISMSNQTSNLNAATIFEEPCAPWILVMLVIIALGAGAIQANMPVFGVEQIQGSKIRSRYFDKHIVAVNIAAILAKLVIPAIQDNPDYYYVGYVFAATMIIVSAILFIIGRRYYIHVKPYDTVLTQCIPVLMNAFHTWREYEKNKHSTNKEHTNSCPTDSTNDCDSPTEEEDSIRIDDRPSTFLDFAKAVNNGKFNDRIVDDVKSLRYALVIFSLLIPYWLIYNQLDSTFPSQRKHMKMSQDVKDANTSNTLVSFGDPVTVIIGILILNLFVYKYLDARNRSLTIKTRFIIGMCFASITMCIAGIVEVFRQKSCPENREDSDLSIYYHLPQNIFMGFSELFVMVASFEFAYFAARRSAQSLFMSLRFCSIGISSFFGSLFIYVYPRTTVFLDFLCNTELQWHWSFYTYFFILVAIQLLFIIIFIVCEKKFQIVKLNPQQVETNQVL